MIKKPVTLQSDLDMESRPIAHLVQEASQYDSTVYMKINAKSIMGMMALQSHQPGKGTNLTLIAEGDDEEQAVSGVESFLLAQ